MTHEQMEQHRQDLEFEIRRLLIQFREKTGLTPINVNVETTSFRTAGGWTRAQIDRVEVVAQL